MNDLPQDAGGRFWPCGLLGMLAIVLAVETCVTKHETDFTTIWSSAWARSGRQARKEAADSEVICLGDSLIKYGVLPRVLEARLGRSAYNLAVFNGQAPTTYFLLRRVLEAGAHPLAVIIDGETLEEDPRTRERRWMDLLEPREIVEFAWSSRDVRLLGALIVGRYVPTFRDRHEIRSSVVAALAGVNASGRGPLLIHWRNWNANRGAHVVPESPSADGRRDEIARSNYLPADWSCHPINSLYVSRIMDLAASKGIPVFWLLPPLHPDIHERRVRGGMHQHFLRFVREVQARYPNVTVIDGRDADYSPSAFADLTHLNALGASHFSSDVGDLIRAALAGELKYGHGPGWVTLPSYRERPTVVPFEDLTQSAAALAAGNGGRIRR